MVLYWIIAGIVLCIVEIFTPVLFCLNLGLACFVAAIGAKLGLSLIWQVLVFAVFSAAFLAWLRPLLVKKKQEHGDGGFNEKYIGKTAQVIETVTPEQGRIKLYGEEWQAKSADDRTIEVGASVKIVKNDSIVMYVEPEITPVQ